MARPIPWPRASLPEADAPTPPSDTLLERLDSMGFQAALGPDLSRLFGTRISARPADQASVSAMPPMLAVGHIRLASSAGPVPLGLAIEAAAAGNLVQRLFGSSPADASRAPESAFAALPPGSSSWISLCRFLAAAVGQAMAAAGNAPAGAPALPPRAAPPESPHGATSLAVGLDIDGTHALLLLTDLSTPKAPPAPAPPPVPDAQLWRRRAHARTLMLELPVALRLADTRLALADVAALRAGDILPLARPRALGILVDGAHLADIPAHRLLPETSQKPTP